MLQKPHIVVVGSINMDLVARAQHLPRPGQTVAGRDFREIPGGKGANQAVGVARVRGRCTLIGCAGDDAYGEQLLQTLSESGVETAAIRRVSQCSSGLALISVEDSGENAIIIIPGANAHLSSEDLLAMEGIIGSADVLLVQLEIPLPTVETALNLARIHGVRTVLDPAPAPDRFPVSFYDVDILCPNSLESETITGMPVTDVSTAHEAARELHRRGTKNAMITLGEQGVVLCDEDGHCEHVPAFEIEVEDTTAAGDAFAAAISLGLAKKMTLMEAVRFGYAAGALAASCVGAQQSMPHRSDVEYLVQ